MCSQVSQLFCRVIRRFLHGIKIVQAWIHSVFLKPCELLRNFFRCTLIRPVVTPRVHYLDFEFNICDWPQAQQLATYRPSLHYFAGGQQLLIRGGVWNFPFNPPPPPPTSPPIWPAAGQLASGHSADLATEAEFDTRRYITHYWILCTVLYRSYY